MYGEQSHQPQADDGHVFAHLRAGLADALHGERAHRGERRRLRRNTLRRLRCQQGRHGDKLGVVRKTRAGARHEASRPDRPGFIAAATALIRSINQGERVPEALLSLSAPADLTAQINASRAYGQCLQGPLTSGGPDSGVVRLTCDRGNLDMRLSVDNVGLITGLRIGPAAGEVCVP